MTGRLTLRYTHDAADDLGWLEAALQSEKFSGRAGMWAQWQEIVELADRMAAYPLAAEAPIEAAWGFEALEGNDLIVGIAIRPSGPRGELLATVELADHMEPANRLQTSFTTHYQELQDFGIALKRVMKGEAEEAVLLGD